MSESLLQTRSAAAVAPWPDWYRPRFHFTAPRHWINDPNGLCFHDGRYHLYFQHHPSAPRWGDLHWGHASSGDLLQWRDEPFALKPSPGFDECVCFSGSLRLRVLLDRSVLEVYANERLCMATRVYPALQSSTGGSAFVEGGADVALKVWSMGSIHAARVPQRNPRGSRGNEGPLPSFLDPLGGPDAKRQVWGCSAPLELEGDRHE